MINETAWGSLANNGKSSGGPMMEASVPENSLEKNLVLVYDTATAYLERTGGNFWDDLSPTEQRRELEHFKEDHETS